MWTSSRLCAAALLLLSNACGGGSGVNSLPGGGGSNRGAGGNYASGNATGNPSGFCVLGSQGCPCDSTGTCSSGLSCSGSICCSGSNCSTPSAGGGSSTLPAGGNTGTGNAGNGNPNGSAGKPGNQGAGGSGAAVVCTPGVVGPVITDCGYPYASSNPLTDVLFNESTVLKTIAPSGGSPLASVRVFYNDEHALTLGVRSVVVSGSSGMTSTDFPVSQLASNPGAVRSPETGTNALSGDLSGTDPVGRPMWPALFVTDTTNDQNSRSGDWQQGGTAWNPSAVFGTWKSAVRTLDKSVTPNTVTVTPDADPDKNNWNLGGGDPLPSSLTSSSTGMGMGMMGMGMNNEGYGAEARWDLVLVPGHSYRIQVMVHDGDQNQVGGDSGEACVNFCADSSCPEGSMACGPDSPCPIETESVCVSGCCI